MTTLKYRSIWIALVNIKPERGFNFMELIDSDGEDLSGYNYIGAWVNVLIKSESIYSALDLIKGGLAELHFEIEFIDKIENVASLVENKQIEDSIIQEVESLEKSEFLFMISYRLYPYE